MAAARQRWLARTLLILGAVAVALWLARVDYASRLSTDVTDLIPASERAPELALVRALAGDRQARTLLFAITGPEPGAPALAAAAEAFTRALRAEPAIAEAVPLDDPGAREALGAYLFHERFRLLLPGWLAEAEEAHRAAGPDAGDFGPWLARRTVTELDAFLASPESLALADLVPADPLLLLPRFARQAPALGGQPSAPALALVWARSVASPLAEEGQEPVFAAVERAWAAARAPGLELAWTGVHRLAAESKRRIRSEVTWLNAASIGAVLAVAVAFLRRPAQLLHLVPVVAGSIAVAWAVTLAVFPRVHVLVFVVGSLLAGVAIDYAFHLSTQPRRPGESYAGKVRRLRRPLLTSCLTTVVGFSFLLFSELPLLRHLGVFVSAGLVAALAIAVLYFAQLAQPELEGRRWPALPVPRWRAAIGVLALGVAAGGGWLLHWHDDVRELEVPAPELRANDAAVRASFGETPGRTLYLARGATVAEARESLARLEAWHAGAWPGSPLASLGEALPRVANLEALAARRARLGDFAGELGRALAEAGYAAEEFAPFFERWRAEAARPAPTGADLDALAAGLQEHLAGPLASLVHFGPGESWLMAIADHPGGVEPPPEVGAIAVSQLQGLNRLFSRYRESALRLSLAGLALIGAGVFALYGWRRGGRIFAVSAGSCLCAFGALGVAGETLNLFHLLGAFLGVCLSHDYAIFAAEAAGPDGAPPASIRLSALTTTAAFAVLAFSRIPVVSALGVTVALTVVIALAAVELRLVEPHREESA